MYQATGLTEENVKVKLTSVAVEGAKRA